MGVFDPAVGLEVLSADADNVVARHGNLAVQVRSGAMTTGALEQMRSLGALLLKKSDGPMGAVSVIEATAEPSAAGTRAKQRETIAGLVADPKARLAVVIAGDGVMASLQRTVARMMVPGRVRITNEVRDAAESVAEHVGRPASEIEAIVEHVRELARAARE